nr:RNA-directed DNA polymerase, eukaryota [Tanacetum cinerariifolium]
SEVDGFEKLIVETWSDTAAYGLNDMLNLMYKLKNLKKKIRGWNSMRQSFKNSKTMLKLKLADVELVINKGNASKEVIYKRLEIVNSINELDKQQAMETTQKAKIKLAIKGDENSKYYHGILNKKGTIQLSVGCWKLENGSKIQICFTMEEIEEKQSFIFKIDFEKAYDSVRWDYLEDVLKKFGFEEKWCKWIRECLRSSWGSVIVNRSPMEEFRFFKGLKQGDPLSPFLFILIMESLHLTFQNVVDAGMFKGIVINSSMVLSHMFFANDAVFVGQWSNSNINTIIYALKCFERASGLRMNMYKSKIMGLPLMGIRDIVFEMEAEKDKGADLFSFMQKRLGDGIDTCFWKDT